MCSSWYNNWVTQQHARRNNENYVSRSHWPRGLRLGIATVHVLELRDRIPPGAWMFVCCQVEASATSWSLVQRIPTDYGASLRVIQKPREWGDPLPLGAVVPETNLYN